MVEPIHLFESLLVLLKVLGLRRSCEEELIRFLSA